MEVIHSLSPIQTLPKRTEILLRIPFYYYMTGLLAQAYLLTNLILAIDDGTLDNVNDDSWSTFSFTMESGHKYAFVLTCYHI